MPFGAIFGIAGSPPRAWGQSIRCAPVSTRERFTPTGVGTIIYDAAYFVGWSVHPHGRGDNAPKNLSEEQKFGSPPRAWGQYLLTSPSTQRSRFTPTGVGTMVRPSLPRHPAPVHPHGRGDNTPRSRRIRGSNAVHPHGRGDNEPNNQRQRRLNGSPPRAWGQCRRALRGAHEPRFTPTGVGTMTNCGKSNRARAVHPHGRGDNRHTYWLAR